MVAFPLLLVMSEVSRIRNHMTARKDQITQTSLGARGANVAITKNVQSSRKFATYIFNYFQCILVYSIEAFNIDLETDFSQSYTL